ncbi:MAG: TonB-dependent receptor [Alphaproteobacteria bacterium]|nr:TonB-dependent receptor [Alphaproteobacteria bacterium]MBV9371737.1 TonB-dependent receptor [Alphaproteobacteria bacterium]MBV9902513.1 TonB-dependent receptor [Alphaproteobacteria bacterium]
MIPLLLLAAAEAAPAADPPRDSIVVTGRRVGGETGPEPYAVSTVRAEEAAALPGLAEALARLPDVEVQQPGGRGGFTSIFLRGADPNFTTVMFESIPVNDPTNSRGGAADISALTPLGLERIEVVRGALTSDSGSGGLAGAINLILPGGAPRPSTSLAVAAGSEDDVSLLGQLRAPLGGGIGGSLGLLLEDGGEPVAGSSFRSASLFGKVARLGGGGRGGRFVFRLGASEAEAFPDNSGGPRYAAIRATDRRRTREALAGGALPVASGRGWALEATGSFLWRDTHFTTPGVAPGGFDPFGLPKGLDDSRYRRADFQLGARGGSTGAIQWVAGVAGRREDGRSRGRLVFFGFPLPTSYRLTRWTESAFAEVNRETAQWQVNAAARVDRVDGLGSHLTGRIGLAYRPGGGAVALRLAAGTGFKAPSFYALGNPLVGNPALRPERSRTAEAGLRWTFMPGGSLDLTAFAADYLDLVDFVPGPPPRLENVARVRARGGTAELKALLGGGFTLLAGATLARVRNAGSGARLIARPDWRGNAGLAWAPSTSFALSGRFRYVGRRADYAIPTGPLTLSAYSRLALDATWRLRPGFTLSGEADIGVDGRREEAIGFVAPGAAFRLLLRRDF